MKKQKKSSIIPYPEGIFYINIFEYSSFFLCTFFFKITLFITMFYSALLALSYVKHFPLSV